MAYYYFRVYPLEVDLNDESALKSMGTQLAQGPNPHSVLD